jgi:hypothetical protein
MLFILLDEAYMFSKDSKGSKEASDAKQTQHDISRSEWDEQPFPTLIRAFLQATKYYTGGDVVIQIPRTDLEIKHSIACGPAKAAWEPASSLCKGAVWYKGTGEITFPEKPFPTSDYNSVLEFKKAIQNINELSMSQTGVKRNNR